MKGTIFLKAIREGSKKFEGRVNGSQCRKMQVGDTLRFFDRSAGWGILCEIISLDAYPDFRSMLEDKGILALLPQLKRESCSKEKLMEKALAIYHGFPKSERVKKLGAVAIGVKWVKDISE